MTAGAGCGGWTGQTALRQRPAPVRGRARGSGPGCRPPAAGVPGTNMPPTAETPAAPPYPCPVIFAPDAWSLPGPGGWRAEGVPLNDRKESPHTPYRAPRGQPARQPKPPAAASRHADTAAGPDHAYNILQAGSAAGIRPSTCGGCRPNKWQQFVPSLVAHELSGCRLSGPVLTGP